MSILQYRTVRVEENLCKQLGADPAYTKMLTHSAKFRWHFFSLYPWHKWFSLWSLNVRWFFIKRTMAFFLGQDQTEFWCLTEMSLQIFVWYGTPWQCTALCSAETRTTGTPLSPSGAEVKFSLDLCSSPNLSSNSCHYFLITSFNNLLGFWGWNMNFLLL